MRRAVVPAIAGPSREQFVDPGRRSGTPADLHQRAGDVPHHPRQKPIGHDPRLDQFPGSWTPTSTTPASARRCRSSTVRTVPRGADAAPTTEPLRRPRRSSPNRASPTSRSPRSRIAATSNRSGRCATSPADQRLSRTDPEPVPVFPPDSRRTGRETSLGAARPPAPPHRPVDWRSAPCTIWHSARSGRPSATLATCPPHEPRHRCVPQRPSKRFRAPECRDRPLKLRLNGSPCPPDVATGEPAAVVRRPSA